MILDGLVKVNGQRVDSLPAFIDPEKDQVTVRGRPVRPVQKVYYVLNKPKGVICTNLDPQGRPKAVDLVPQRPMVSCVGRLEADTTGLIVLTNDTSLAAGLARRDCPVARTYLVTVKGRIEDRHIEKIVKGACLPDGRSKASAVKVVSRNKRQSVIEVSIGAGVHCHLQRLLMRVGLEVIGLKRTRFGPIFIKGLGQGMWRRLTNRELAQLRAKVFGQDPGHSA